MSRRSAGYDRWTEEETFRFIRARIELDDLFTNKTFDQREAWERVGREALVEKPFQKLKKKWQNLIIKYKQIKEPATGVSTEDDLDLPTSWPFYDELDGFLSSRHNINPPFVISSATATATNDEMETPVPPESELFDVTEVEETESHFSFERVFSSTPSRGSRTQSLSSVSQRSQTSREARGSTPQQLQQLPSTSGLQTSRRARSSTPQQVQQLPSTSGLSSMRRKLSALEADEMKTNKKFRKVATLFERFMQEKFNLAIDSSDSE